MKQGNMNRRGRGRGQRKPHGMGGQHGGGMSKGPQTLDSNGPDIRVRGNAHQVLEKYLQMARDAGVIGDRVAAENYLQHAEHYYRTIAAQTEGQRPRVGGRELSVADVNVQNVSQGLSAALYAAPGLPADGVAVAGDQSGVPGANGNYADTGDEHDPFNSYGSQGGNGQGGNSRGDRSGNGRDYRDHNAAEGRGNENRGNDTRGNDTRSQEPRGQESRGQEPRNQESRGEGRGPRRFPRGGRDGQRQDNQRFDGQRSDGQRADGQRSEAQRADAPRPDNQRADNAPVDGNRFIETKHAEPAQAAAPVRAADRAAGEQPDYPAELLAQPVIVQPAVTPPEAQPILAPAGIVQPSLALAPANGAEVPADGAEAAPVRRGRGRPRGTTSTPRRPRGAAAAEGETTPAPGSTEAGE